MTYQGKFEIARGVDEIDIAYIREAAHAMPEFAPLYVPLIEAPKWFGVSKDTLYRASKNGAIRIYKVGSRSVVKVSEIKSWIERPESAT